jgi:hypothetical protein
VQDADNFNPSHLDLTVEYKVFANQVFTVAGTEVITIPTHERIGCQVVEASVQNGQVTVPLFAASSVLSVAAYGLQVRLGCMG